MFINRGIALNPQGYPGLLPTLPVVLNNLGLTTNLRICLDACDPASYGGGDKWLDRSGQGTDFYLGTGTGSDAADPAFIGAPGAVSKDTYFSFDGGDTFTLDSANESWMDDIHQDSAIFSMVAWVQIATVGANQGWAGTMGATAGNTGFRWMIRDVGSFQFGVTNAGATVILVNPATVMVAGAWTFVGISLTEATGASGAHSQTNATAGTHTSTYTSPSAAAASFAMGLGARGNLADPMSAGSKMGMFAAWGGTAIGATALDNIFQATRGRYGV